MEDVTRYYCGNGDGMFESKDGHYVTYAKYKELLDRKEMKWISIKDGLPKHLETVWITNGKGWTTLGCLVVSDGGWHWAEMHGIVYQENRKIVAECESEDLDVEYWQALPDCIMK